MEELKHLVVIDAPVHKVYHALTEQASLAGWWTEQTVVQEVTVGSTIDFRFGDRYFNKMRIVALEPNTRIEWECLEGDDEWLGTTFLFLLEEKEGQAAVRFSHGNWRAATDFFAHCNYHWGFYLHSLKLYCETGEGEPFTNSSSASID